MTGADDIRERTLKSLGWAVTQSWGSKILAFIIFVVLARLVTPAEFGVVAAGSLVAYFLSLTAEFGFGDALIQKPDLTDQDVNLPFFVSVGCSTVLGATFALCAPLIEKLLDVPGLSNVVVAMAILAPISTMTLFQDMLYRRHMMFKRLALRSLLGMGMGGLVAILAAFAGLGVWALVIQQYVTVFVSLIWLWSRPVWKPSTIIHTGSFKRLAQFGSAIFGTRLLDFVAVRSADVIIVSLFGPIALGLYTAGSKLYQTLMLLLQTVISDVALTVLSKIAHDRKRVSGLYLKSVTFSIAFISPIFVVCAAVTPEICHILFADKWTSIDTIVRPLLLLGAVHCVQFLNPAYYTAVGRPSFLLYFNLLKIVGTATAFWLSRNENISTFVVYFCWGQLVTTIPTFFFLSRLLGFPMRELILRFLPFIVSATLGYAAVSLCRNVGINIVSNSFLRGMAFGLIFVIVYSACVLATARGQIIMLIEFVKLKKHKQV